jgi:chromosome condensin MukBEF ATPase and DNA-binding subunit MukB
VEKDEFITQVLSTIDEAEVMTIFFPYLAKALVIDTRISRDEKPLVRVMNQVNSMEERMGSLERMRPSLGRVRSIAGIPWTKSVRTLKENEVINRLERRLLLAGLSQEEATQLCTDAFRKLRQVEQAQWIDLIKGESPLY